MQSLFYLTQKSTNFNLTSDKEDNEESYFFLVIFVLALGTLIIGVAFTLAYFSYIYFIHKKEKAFALTSYSKWSIIVSMTIVIANPLMIILDRFKNHFMENVPITFRPYFDFVSLACLGLVINNNIIKSIYQGRNLRKLSKKFKFVSTNFFLLNFIYKFFKIKNSLFFINIFEIKKNFNTSKNFQNVEISISNNSNRDFALHDICNILHINLGFLLPNQILRSRNGDNQIQQFPTLQLFCHPKRKLVRSNLQFKNKFYIQHFSTSCFHRIFICLRLRDCWAGFLRLLSHQKMVSPTAPSQARKPRLRKDCSQNLRRKNHQKEPNGVRSERRLQAESAYNDKKSQPKQVKNHD